MSLLVTLLSGREELRTEQMIKKKNTQNLVGEGMRPKKRP